MPTPENLRDFQARMLHATDQCGRAFGAYAAHLWTYYQALTAAGFSPEFSESMVMSLDTRIGMYTADQRGDVD